MKKVVLITWKKDLITWKKVLISWKKVLITWKKVKYIALHMHILFVCMKITF